MKQKTRQKKKKITTTKKKHKQGFELIGYRIQLKN